MNQIIYPEKIENNLRIYKNEVHHKIKTYKSLFIFSCISLLIFLGYYIFSYFKILKHEKLSKNILEVYDIQQLYSSNTPTELPNIILENGEATNILGIIQIDKINLRYPILAKTTDDFLEIAPCKFYGNELNGYGNFCIAGHNYDNNQLFSNLRLLETDDIVSIYNLDGSYISYIIYDIFETFTSDTSCLSQIVDGREITLITCNNKNKKRLIIKAKENG